VLGFKGKILRELDLGIEVRRTDRKKKRERKGRVFVGLAELFVQNGPRASSLLRDLGVAPSEDGEPHSQAFNEFRLQP